MRYLKPLIFILLLVPNVMFAQGLGEGNRRIIIDEEEIQTPSEAQESKTNRTALYGVMITFLVVVAVVGARKLLKENSKK
jgi:hypothetical protein